MTVHVSEGRVATIELRRPQRANAYDRATLRALDEAITDLSTSARVVVIQSAGQGAFCGGADLAELGSVDPLDALDLLSQQVFHHLARAPFVSLAAIHGPAVAGGFELALACDLRVAGPEARFSLPETGLGLLPSAGGTTRLAAAVGSSRAKGIILGGQQVSAEQALAWGLVHRLAHDPRAEALTWAGEVARRDPVAMRLARSIIDSGQDESLHLERVSEALLYSLRIRD